MLENLTLGMFHIVHKDTFVYFYLRIFNRNSLEYSQRGS